MAHILIMAAAKEDDFTESTIIKSHYCNDVIFGRGMGISSWPGNVAFRHTVWKYRQQYMAARHKNKREVARDVTLEIKSLNGRFLIINPTTGNYHEVSKKRAEDKACQSLRQKDSKEPVGFNLKAMKNQKKWFRSLITNKTNAHDCMSIQTEAPDDDTETPCSSSNDDDTETPRSSSDASKRSSSLAQRATEGEQDNVADYTAFLLDVDLMEFNDDGMSMMTLNHMPHQIIPFPSESNQSEDGFGDDDSVLGDLKTWPGRDFPAF